MTKLFTKKDDGFNTFVFCIITFVTLITLVAASVINNETTNRKYFIENSLTSSALSSINFEKNGLMKDGEIIINSLNYTKCWNAFRKNIRKNLKCNSGGEENISLSLLPNNNSILPNKDAQNHDLSGKIDAYELYIIGKGPIENGKIKKITYGANGTSVVTQPLNISSFHVSGSTYKIGDISFSLNGTTDDVRVFLKAQVTVPWKVNKLGFIDLFETKMVTKVIWLELATSHIQ